jgi:hypothetical protein
MVLVENPSIDSVFYSLLLSYLPYIFFIISIQVIVGFVHELSH